MRIQTYLSLYRIKHWVKNLLVFAPPFFAFRFEGEVLLRAFVAFLSFSLLSSAVYALNDAADAEKDRLHPVKRLRPVASGLVSRREALLHALLLSALSFALGALVGILPVLLLYLLTNLFYSLYGKNLPLFDAVLVSAGFLMRLYAGSLSTGVPLSGWIFVVTFHLALFIALAKRLEDLEMLEKGLLTREVALKYNREFILASLVLSATTAIVLYAIYAVVEHGETKLYLTTPLVVLGFLRYFYQVLVLGRHGSPVEVFLRDRLLQLLILLWLGCYYALVRQLD